MSDTLTADLATGAETPSFLPSDDAPVTTTEPQDLGSMLDKALEDAPPVDDPSAPDDNVDRGDGRNARGRWVGKGKDPKEETAAIAPKPGEQPPPVEPPKPAATFKYRAMGKTHESPYALDEKGNVIIPPDKHGELREAYNALHQRQAEFIPSVQRLQQENAALKQQVEQAKSGTSAVDAQAQKIVEFFTNVANEADDVKALEMMYNMRRDFPLLMANAKAAHLEARLQAGQQPAPKQEERSPYRDEAPSMPTPEAAAAATTEWLEQFKVDHEFRDLSAADWQQIERDAQGSPFAFLRVATPEEVQKRQAAQGQIVFDTDRLYASIQKHAKTQADARATAKATAELAAKNATRTQATISAPPSAGGTQPPPKGAAPSQKKSFDEMLDEAFAES